jgi:hypothetical protein
MSRAPLVNLRVPPAEREAWVAAAGSESLSAWIRRVCNTAAARSGLGLAERTVPVAEPRPGTRVQQPRSERDRLADAAVAALQAIGQRPEAAVEEPAPAAVEKPDPYRVGRCRQHPNALPSLLDVNRCSWNCRLPPD